MMILTNLQIQMFYKDIYLLILQELVTLISYLSLL